MFCSPANPHKPPYGRGCSALDEDGDGQISQQEMECWIRWNLSQGAALDDPTASAYKKDDQFMLGLDSIYEYRCFEYMYS